MERIYQKDSCGSEVVSATSPITYHYDFERFGEWEHLPRPNLIRITPHGDDMRGVSLPPKHRPLSIALGRDNRIFIAFPFGNANLEGFHDYAEGWLNERIGSLRTWTIFRGAIYSEQRKRVVDIFRMNPDDKKILFKDGPIDLGVEAGKVDPKPFLDGPGFIPERIMQVLTAKELRVINGTSSRVLYGLDR